MFRLGLILMSICTAASLVLATTYKMTQPAIEAQKINQENYALKAILPRADEFRIRHIDGLEYYEGLKAKEPVGFILKAKANGYSGGVSMLVGIDEKGVIQAIEILSQQETPGLGSKIAEIKQGQRSPWFLEQFKGRFATGLNFSDIQAITGATISSRAVAEGVRMAVEEFMAKAKR